MSTALLVLLTAWPLANFVLSVGAGDRTTRERLRGVQRDAVGGMVLFALLWVAFVCVRQAELTPLQRILWDKWLLASAHVFLSTYLLMGSGFAIVPLLAIRLRPSRSDAHMQQLLGALSRYDAFRGRAWWFGVALAAMMYGILFYTASLFARSG